MSIVQKKYGSENIFFIDLSMYKDTGDCLFKLSSKGSA